MAESDQDVAQEFLSLFAGRQQQLIKRRLHRCLECGTVTKHVFCPSCSQKRMKEKADHA